MRIAQARMERFFHADSGKTVIVPVDDSLISGAKDGLMDMEACLSDIGAAAPQAVLGYPGHFLNYGDKIARVPWICNLTASTIAFNHTEKVRVLSVLHAVRMGCDAVAVHLNVSSRYQQSMLSVLGLVICEAAELGIPVLAIAYPRREQSDGHDDNYEALKLDAPDVYADLVSHGVRIAVDLGAAIVKTQYTGTAESFAKVIGAAGKVPVVVAGGPNNSPLSTLELAAEVISTGAAGVSFGRRVFNASNRVQMILALKKVVHHGATPETALGELRAKRTED